MAESIADDASRDDVDERVGEHREEEVHDQEQPPDTDANVEGFSTSAGADTVPVSQGDGTLQMEVVALDAKTEIDLIEVQSAFDLPDPENLDDPTIAYVNDDDDYAGVFQE